MTTPEERMAMTVSVRKYIELLSTETNPEVRAKIAWILDSMKSNWGHLVEPSVFE